MIDRLVYPITDRAVEFPRRFEDQDGELVTLLRASGEIYEEGSPLNAKTFNEMQSSMIESSGKTIRTLRVPTSEDNSLRGYRVGDRWLKPSLTTRVVNLVPNNWDTLNTWTQTQIGTGSTLTAGVSAQGVRYIQCTTSVMGNRGYRLEGRSLAGLVDGHMYFVGVTGRIVAFSQQSNVAPLPTIRARLSFLGADVLAAGTVSDVGSVISSGIIVENDQGLTTSDISLLLDVNTFMGSNYGAGTIALQAPLIIDLTEAFGAGSEPDIDQCREMFQAPPTMPISVDFERYFTERVSGEPAKYFICSEMRGNDASWPEVLLDALPATGQLIAAAGYALEYGKHWRIGSFVYFEIKLQVTTARSAGNISQCLTGLPKPQSTTRFAATVLNAGGTASVSGSHFMSLMGNDNTAQEGLWSNAVTATTVNQRLVVAGSYRLNEAESNSESTGTTSWSGTGTGSPGAQGQNGAPGADGMDGAPGVDGKSAYQVALDNGFIGTEGEWLLSLKGSDGAAGAPGADGKSAYQVALDNGFSGTEAQWLLSLKGADGAPGTSTTNGVTLTAADILTENDSDVQAELNKKSAIAIRQAALIGTAWNDGIQAVSIAGLSNAPTAVTVDYAGNATQAQREAIRAAMMYVVSVEGGTVTVACDGDIPTINIQIVITEVLS